MLDPTLEPLCDRLFDIGAIKFDFVEGFTLKLHEKHPDWPKSPLYLNLRTDKHPVPEKRGPLDDETMEMVGEAFRPILEATNSRHGIDFIADIPEAGAPFGDQAVRVLKMSDLVRLRFTKLKLPDGTRQIGPLTELKEPRGGLVVLIDDLAMAADTKLEAVKRLEEAGYVVILILVLVDREAGGIERLEDENLRVVAVMKVSDMLDYYTRTERITEEKRDKILNYPQIIKKLQDAEVS